MNNIKPFGYSLIKEAESLLEGVTEGPWFHDYGNWDVESHHPDWWRVEICKQPDGCDDKKSTDVHADMLFIAASRTLVPRLVEAVKELQTALALSCKAGRQDHEENQRLVEALRAVQRTLVDANKCAAHAELENKRLREALEWYANWIDFPNTDRGQRAREALATSSVPAGQNCLGKVNAND